LGGCIERGKHENNNKIGEGLLLTVIFISDLSLLTRMGLTRKTSSLRLQ